MAKKPTKTLRATRPKSGKTPAKPPRRKKPQKGILARAFGWLFRSVFRVIWWVGIRTAVVGTLGMAAWVGYYYMTLPPMEEQLDGRAGGSVVLLDRDREIYAWRGEQFDGSLRAGTVSPHLKTSGFTHTSVLARAELPVRYGSTCAKGAGRCRGMVVRP